MTLKGSVLQQLKKKTENVVDISRELELEMKSEDMTDLLQSYYKTLIDEELLFMDKPREWFLEVQSIPGVDAVKTVEMTRRILNMT